MLKDDDSLFITSLILWQYCDQTKNPKSESKFCVLAQIDNWHVGGLKEAKCVDNLTRAVVHIKKKAE